MSKKKRLSTVNRRLTPQERLRHEKIREAAYRDFPPIRKETPPSPPGIPSQIRRARQAKGLTWYALAKLAGIANQGTVRDIEHGKDTKLSNLQAVAAALGLRLDLVEQAS
jgi:hypothetical protein